MNPSFSKSSDMQQIYTQKIAAVIKNDIRFAAVQWYSVITNLRDGPAQSLLSYCLEVRIKHTTIFQIDILNN